MRRICLFHHDGTGIALVDVGLSLRIDRQLSAAHCLAAVVHGLGLAGLAALHSEDRRSPPAIAPTFLTLIRVEEATVAREAHTVAAAPPLTTARRPRLARDPMPHPLSEAAATATAGAEAARREILRSRRAEGDRLELAPAHVALSTLAAPNPRARRDRPVNLTVRARQPDLETQLTEDLTTTANHRAYLTDRPPPELRALLDGSYRYAGPLLGATIHPNGRVEFDDRLDVGASFSPTDVGVALVGTLDLTSLIMKAAGQDPLRAERAWFMRETRNLRERLMAEDDRDAQAHALSALRRQLHAIWASPSAPNLKRRQLFDLWDSVSEDELGQPARRRIFEFIQDLIPAGSNEAFPPSELRELNALRESRQRFEPYCR